MSSSALIKKLNISVVTYKTPRAEIERLVRVAASSDVINKLFIIENGDHLIQGIEWHPKVNLIHRPDNPGYGTGHNIGLSRSLQEEIPFHLVVNADVEIMGDVVEALVEFMLDSTSVGLVSPRIINPDGSDQGLSKLLPRPIDLVARLLPTNLYGAKNIVIEADERSTLVSSPFLSGCFMLLRVSALREVGYFDERFFMYGEDMDLSRRIYASYDCVMFNELKLVHHHGAASKRSLRMFLIHVINIVRYFNKWGWVVDEGRDRLNDEANYRNRSSEP